MRQDAPEPTAGSRTIGNLLDFLIWVAARPRTYAETMDAWRTSCPRLSAWEDAIDDDLVRLDTGNAATQGQTVVRITDRGAALLDRHQVALPQP